ncbi:MAG: hypothetical protein WAO52_00390 [Prolixibacteraceae bacterium]
MKNLIKSTVVFFFILAVVNLSSCNKEASTPELVVAKTNITDYANIISSFATETEDELTSSDDSYLKSASLSTCFNVTVWPNANGEFYPRNWTVDYQGTDCVYLSGNTKQGKIKVSLTDFWKNEGSLRTVTYEDFYLNGNKLEGVKTILNTGLNENGNLSFTKTVKDAKLTYADGTSISWECEKYSEMIAGRSTFLFADDVWSVNGSGKGVNLDGTNYTINITSPLVYNNGCFYPVSGTLQISTEGHELQTIDYGNGECDNLATVTSGGVTSEIEL